MKMNRDVDLWFGAASLRVPAAGLWTLSRPRWLLRVREPLVAPWWVCTAGRQVLLSPASQGLQNQLSC